MIVCKFGGSSVADATQIKKVKAILEADERRQIVVVSAPGKRSKEDTKVTDLLLSCYAMVQKKGSCDEVFHQVAERYQQIMRDLQLDESLLTEELQEVQTRINGGESRDYAASRGEYLNALLVSKYLGWSFLDAEKVIALAPDGTVAPKTWFNLKKAIQPDKKYVVPGFYGQGEDGKIKTFSRGGSDISGAILSKAVLAELYENWTDVAGCFSADPRSIEGAYPNKSMTYQEVRELSAFGASVFHEEAIMPVRAENIPINIKNTNDPTADGTLICSTRDINGPKLVGVSAVNGYTKLVIEKIMLFKNSSIRHAIVAMMHLKGISPAFSLYGVDSLVLYFDSAMISDEECQKMCERLKDEFYLDTIYCERGYAIIGIVGQGLTRVPHIVTEASLALQKADIDVKFLNYGASPVTLMIGVAAGKSHDAVQALFNELFLSL